MSIVCRSVDGRSRRHGDVLGHSGMLKSHSSEGSPCVRWTPTLNKTKNIPTVGLAKCPYSAETKRETRGRRDEECIHSPVCARYQKSSQDGGGSGTWCHHMGQVEGKGRRRSRSKGYQWDRFQRRTITFQVHDSTVGGAHGVVMF